MIGPSIVFYGRKRIAIESQLKKNRRNNASEWTVELARVSTTFFDSIIFPKDVKVIMFIFAKDLEKN